MRGIADTAHELAAFLRIRREQLDPLDFGLPQRRSRRTPGLRREEVAELAGVSTDYIARLEQARGLRPSPEVLESLSRALRLDPDERAYLFDLALLRPPGVTPADTLPLRRLVADLSPLPAMLVNHRNDILAWNPELAALMLDFGALPVHQRNSMWLALRHPAMREFYVERERVLAEGIADLRAAWAAHPDDRVLARRIAEFMESDAEFARLWNQRTVRVNSNGHKVFRHAQLGTVTVRFDVLMPLQDPDQRLVIYRISDPAVRSALDQLIQDSSHSPQ